MGDIYGSLLNCLHCDHAIGSHEAGGCRELTCRCNATMQTVLSHIIEIEKTSHRESFATE